MLSSVSSSMRIPCAGASRPRPRSKTPDLPRRSCPCVAGVGVVDPGPRRVVVRARLGAMHGPAVNCERAARRSGQRRLQACGRRGPLVVHPSHEIGKIGSRSRVAGPCATCENESPSAVPGLRGGRDKVRPTGPSAPDPPSPTGRCRDRTHELPQAVLATSSPFAHFGRLPVRAGNVSCLGKHALFPGCGDLGRQVQRGNPGVVAFEIPPEQQPS